MASTIRKCVLALGGAALISTQAVHAAPQAHSAPTDPLIALSLLGGGQSRAALCANSAACGAPVAVASATTASTAASGSPAVTTAAAAAAMQARPQGARSKGMIELFAIVGVMLLIAVAATAIGGGDDDEPVSPA